MSEFIHDANVVDIEFKSQSPCEIRTAKNAVSHMIHMRDRAEFSAGLRNSNG